ncbi:polyadenylation and cleavage factor homolog 4 isoform X2 [Lactuca sativa]|uniref:polyadenylation and cleavage factor homolog 4 isoform X2 n=1 Tax=Lactuca sativa TaxID=4236 RepID=UPI000CADF1A4|nr:polyadenylation and cleavage factor homolog 4 isoform X2 [Lactuca sativa]
MEMDNTSRGRSFDRSSRNPATLKKPRLVTEEPTILRSNNNPNGNNRPIVQRPSVGFRPAVERDGDSESYQPQSLSQIKQQQHQELVSQYRTALAELTFNSKPIITNLTIIAGENAQAAKAIAATICNNIIEVPSDQKLPSLYLLDSIVKNIGRDYIRHFSTKLPEVFCKAYRQVDSALHSGMRHLFGTWKGVFPPQSLQSIEKELGFSTVGNGNGNGNVSSSGLTTSRPESQPQRPARSIHVNPKYLEARQKLQQSNRPKVAASDISTTRADPRLKLHAQRDPESDLTNENYEFGSDISSPSEGSFGKSNGRVGEQGLEKTWYGSVSNTTDTISRLERNGHTLSSNYSLHKSSIPDVKSQPINNLIKGSGEVSRSWKNSEEEEYLWDDVSSRTVNPILTSSNSSKRDPRLYFDPDRPGFDNRLQKSQRMHEKESSPDLPSAEQRIPLPSTSLRAKGSFSTDENSFVGASRNLLHGSKVFPSSSSGVSVSTSLDSLSRISLQSLKAARSQGQISQDSQKSKLQNLHPMKRTPFPPPHQEPVSEPSVQFQPQPQPPKPLPVPRQQKPVVADIPGLSSTSSLLAAVSSIFGKKTTTQSMSSSLKIPSSHESTSLSSSLLGTTPSTQSTTLPNPESNVSSLLSTLLSKGLISASEDNNNKNNNINNNNNNNNKSDDVIATQTPKLTPKVSSKSVVINNKSVVGLEFKPDVIREFNPCVISELIDDLPHQCGICGLRFKVQEPFDNHMEWHVLKNSESNTPNTKSSRRWFLKAENWVNGESDFDFDPGSTTQETFLIDGEQMVTADETQIVCVLCGEIFDDFYNQERNKWMFKRAAYLNIGNGGTRGVIVHENCVSVNSLSDLGLANDVKVEKSV